MKYIKVVFFTLILATICGVLLVGVNAYTTPRIVKYEKFVLYSSVLDALGIVYSRQDIENIFKENINIQRIKDATFYSDQDGAVAFEIKGPGLWGPIYGLIALEPDFTTIRRLLILKQEETPGLGGRIEEKDFLSQFKGKSVLPKLLFLPEGRARASNEIDAITGATGSSKAVEKLLNENIESALALLKEKR